MFLLQKVVLSQSLKVLVVGTSEVRSLEIHQTFQLLVAYVKDKAGDRLYFAYCQQILWKHQNQQCQHLSLT